MSRSNTVASSTHAVASKRASMLSARRSSAKDASGLPSASLRFTDADGLMVSFGRRSNTVYPPHEQFKLDARSATLPPDEELVLEYAYGYSGGNCRDNLHKISDSEVVFSVAAVGVVLDVETNFQRHYFGHTAMITSLAYDSRAKVVASGQGDPPPGTKCFVAIWQPHVCSVGRHCSEVNRLIVEERSVDIVRFMSNGNLLAITTSAPSEKIHRKSFVYLWQAGGISAIRSNIVPLLRASACGERLLGVRADLTSPDMFVTFGVLGHLGFCTFDHQGKAMKKQIAKWGEWSRPKTVTAAHWLDEASRLRLAVGSDTGYLFIFVGDTVVSANQVTTDAQAISDIARHPFDPSVFIVSSFDETIRFVDRQSLDIKFSFKLSAFKLVEREDYRIRTVVMLSNSVAVVGGVANHLFLIENFDTEVEGSLINLSLAPYTEVHGLATNPTRPFEVAVGTKCGKIRFYDHARRCTSERSRCQCEGGNALTLDWESSGEVLAVGTEGGVLNFVQTPMTMAGSELLLVHKVSRERLSEVKFAPGQKESQQRILAVGSSDQKVYVFKVLLEDVGCACERMHVLTGNSSSIVSVQWSADSAYLMSCAKDVQMLFWDLRNPQAKRVDSPVTLRDTLWFTKSHNWCSVLGWPVVGLWGDPQYAQCDVTSVDAARGRAVCALGDSHHQVKLFRFPLPFPNAQWRNYIAHASFVTNVRWSTDDRLFSVGGDDYTLLQWCFPGDEGLPLPLSERRPRRKLTLEEPPEDLPELPPEPETILVETDRPLEMVETPSFIEKDVIEVPVYVEPESVEPEIIEPKLHEPVYVAPGIPKPSELPSPPCSPVVSPREASGEPVAEEKRITMPSMVPKVRKAVPTITRIAKEDRSRRESPPASPRTPISPAYMVDGEWVDRTVEIEEEVDIGTDLVWQLVEIPRKGIVRRQMVVREFHAADGHVSSSTPRSAPVRVVPPTTTVAPPTTTALPPSDAVVAPASGSFTPVAPVTTTTTVVPATTLVKPVPAPAQLTPREFATSNAPSTTVSQGNPPGTPRGIASVVPSCRAGAGTPSVPTPIVPTVSLYAHPPRQVSATKTRNASVPPASRPASTVVAFSNNGAFTPRIPVQAVPMKCLSPRGMYRAPITTVAQASNFRVHPPSVVLYTT